MTAINLWRVKRASAEYYLLADSIADIGRFLTEQDGKKEWSGQILIEPVTADYSVSTGKAVSCYDVRQVAK